MKRINSALFLATVASMALATAASATPPGPNDGDNALHGTGETSTVLIDEINNLPLDFAAIYLGTDSSTGKQAWRNSTPQLGAFGLPFSTWNTIQYAFSASTISASDIAAYNTNVAPIGGAGIMVPKFVLPVALAYNPVYAKNTVTGVEYRFNVQNPQWLPDAVTGLPKHVGGLPLTRNLYCGIFNGTIVNWNAPALTNANGGVPLKDLVDTHWATAGVPIRLVGRLDRSGTTDIFTRALAAQCNSVLGVTNRFLNNAEVLPFNPTVGVAPDFTTVRPDSLYKPYPVTPPAGTFAGTANSVGNQFFDMATGTILVVPGGVHSQPAVVGNGTGLFLLANGSSGVSQAIAADPDIGAATYKVNGKIGYIGSDYIANAKGGSPKLFAAALSRPQAPSTFLLPSASNGAAAIDPIAAPQANNTTGNFQLNDTRLVRNPAGGANIQARRNNPLAWYDVLYPTPTTGMTNPSAGYPITGTMQMLLNTCYKATNRPHIAMWLGSNMGTPTTIFTDPTTGLLAKSNIAAMPADWKHAIIQTFLVNSTESSGGTVLGNLDLWIEAAAPSGTDHCNVTGI